MPNFKPFEQGDYNQCELRCPSQRVTGWVIDLLMPRLGIMQKIEAVAVFGIKGAELLVRATATCPYRNLSAADWQPSQQCAQEARDLLNRVGTWRQPLPAELASGLQKDTPAILEGVAIEIAPPAARPGDGEAPPPT